MRFLILFLFILSTSLIQAQEVLLESKIKKSIENVPAQVGVAIIINGKDTITVNNECHEIPSSFSCTPLSAPT